LTNLAYGTQEDIIKIFNHPMDVLSCVNEILSDLSDLAMIEQTLWFIGNLTGDSE